MDPRILLPVVCEDLAEKMVFLAGPRQVGKTTLARGVLALEPRGTYLNWDNRADRRVVLESSWPAPPALIVLDEFHKYRFWKRWLKGEYDVHGADYRFLITGSARMDVYRKGGDSLQGRYHHLRLHPFSMGELAGQPPRARPFEPLVIPDLASTQDFTRLLERSGFPEPLFAATARAHRRWQKERVDRFFREDVRDLEAIRDLSSMELLADLLPARVGSPLSLNALREELEVSHRAVSHWMDVLERLYFAFRIRPYSARLARGLRKEAKCYLWDWSLVEDAGARFENMVAAHLLKLCHWLEDVEGLDARLCYLRDTAKREVDFVVTIKNKPWFAVEAKLGSSELSPHLCYFGERLRIPLLYQVVAQGARDYQRNGCRVVPAPRWLAGVA
jgi:uncharacterized protein